LTCYVDKKPAVYRVKIRGTSKANPRTYRGLCDDHAVQARAAGYNVQPIGLAIVHFPDGGTNGMVGYVRCGSSGALHPSDHCPNGEDA